MIPQQLAEYVAADIQQHVRQSKGFVQSPSVNPLVPVDGVQPFMVARMLIERKAFDIVSPWRRKDMSMAISLSGWGLRYCLFTLTIHSVPAENSTILRGSVASAYSYSTMTS